VEEIPNTRRAGRGGPRHQSGGALRETTTVDLSIAQYLAALFRHQRVQKTAQFGDVRLQPSRLHRVTVRHRCFDPERIPKPVELLDGASGAPGIPGRSRQHRAGCLLVPFSRGRPFAIVGLVAGVGAVCFAMLPRRTFRYTAALYLSDRRVWSDDVLPFSRRKLGDRFQRRRLQIIRCSE
jgi:hypothetical protein